MPLSRNPPEISTEPNGALRPALVFDPPARELRESGGRVHELRRQSSDVLAELARRPGETVQNTDLIQVVRRNVAVTDERLIQCLADPSRALARETRDCVQTVPRRGYRVVPPLENEGALGWSPPRRAVFLAALAAAALVRALLARFVRDTGLPVPLDARTDQPVVAVLPLANRTGDPDAHDPVLRGLAPLRRFTEEGIEEARRHFRRAIEFDPDYARAHANLALSYGKAIVFRLGTDPSSHDFALREAERAVELDPMLPQAQFALAVVQLAARNHDAATRAARQCVVLDPSYADGYAVLAQTLAYGGERDEALSAIRTAKILNPRYTFAYLWVEAHILFQQRRYEEAREILEDVIGRNPAFLVGHLKLASIYGHLGLTEEADWLKFEILTMSPGISALGEGRSAPYRIEGDREHFVDGLLKAGLPE